jgi:hypothetical protein
VSKVLVCYNCKFKKTLKSEASAVLIIRNHNEQRDPFDKHIMRILDSEEDLKSVKGLPYYDGDVYRTVCQGCNTILDRKTKAGIEYAQIQHILTGEETNRNNEQLNKENRLKGIDKIWPIQDHDFGKPIKDGTNNRTIGKEPVLMKIPRNAYIIKNASEDETLKQHMALYNIKEEDLSKETALATFDPNIFWTSARSYSFNGINGMLWQYFRVYNCSRCGKGWDGWVKDGVDNRPPKQYETFKDLYWHYYREHYIKLVDNQEDDDYMNELREESDRLTAILLSGDRIDGIWNRREEVENRLRILELAMRAGIKVHDTALSMLQQLVMVEMSIVKSVKRGPRNSFRFDRASNALYQLNRVHGISADDLKSLFISNSSGWSAIGERLFHGMVWTENKAPDWLDAVVQTLGDKMEI